jgi:hypothetical protein
VAKKITSFNQYEGDGSPLLAVEGDTVLDGAGASARAKATYRGAPQLTMAKRAGQVDEVLVSIGGNDVGFGTIVQHCLGPASCASPESKKVMNKLLALYETETNKPSNVFAQIAAAFPGVRKLLVPYVLPVAEHSCARSPMSDAEHDTVVWFTRRLNDINIAAADAAGFGVAATESALFANGSADRRLCGNGNLNGAVNLFALNPEANPLTQVAIPRNWFHNSVHPTPLGHRLTALAIARGGEPRRVAVEAGDEDGCENAKACKARFGQIGADTLRGFFVLLGVGALLVAIGALLTRRHALALAGGVARAFGAALPFW